MRKKGCLNKISRKVEFVCVMCGKCVKDYPSRVGRKRFCSRRCLALNKTNLLFSKGNTINLGKKYTKEHRLNISLSLKGKTRPKISKSKMGINNPNWKGGITPVNKKIRKSLQFKEWRKSVFERDNYTCKLCKKRGGELHPDHIKQFAYYPELRFELSNGRTLCRKCHLCTSTWGNNKLPTEQK